MCSTARFSSNRDPVSNPIPVKIPPKISQNLPHYDHLIMARADKSAAVNAAVEAIRRGEFIDYSKAAEHFKCDRTSISKRMRGLTKTRREA